MKISKIKIFIAITVIVLVGAAVFWFFLYRDNKSTLNQRSTPLDQDLTGQVSEKSADMSEAYTNSKYGFSFSHPKGFNVSDFADGGGQMILVKNAASDNGFQIFITAFDELPRLRSGQAGPPAVSSSNPITKERILKDIPDMAISNDKIISLGGESALSFKSKDESGETSEIWFVHPVRSKSPKATADPLADRTSNGVNGYLYQISALPSFEKSMMEILSSWRFSN